MRPGIRVGLISAALVIRSQAATLADVVTYTASVYTNPASNNLLSTNWDTATTTFPGFSTPAIPQFSGDPSTLQSVTVTVDYSLHNFYTLTPTSNPNGATTVTVSAVDPSNPSESPAINVGSGWPLASFQPGFQIAPNNPLAPGLSRSVTLNVGQPSATYSSDPSNPNFVPPFNFDPSFTTTLHPGDSDFSVFLGSGQILFPFIAQGVTTFHSTSGNGSGGVDTSAGATVMVTYTSSAAPAVPEPSTVILLGISVVGLCLVSRVHQRKGKPADA